ncbi:MAG: type II toxin-antitoxin system MqsR family toxin [Desulfobaccales bacterium]
METVSSFPLLPCAIFLKEFKQLIQQGNLLVSYSLKNLNSLASLGLTTEMRKGILLSLTVDDYSSGPEPDHNFPGDVWKFGKEVGEKQLYVKLKIEDQGHRKIAKCLSFHIAEREICTHYKPYK